ALPSASKWSRIAWRLVPPPDARTATRAVMPRMLPTMASTANRRAAMVRAYQESLHGFLQRVHDFQPGLLGRCQVGGRRGRRAQQKRDAAVLLRRDHVAQ